MPIRHRGDVVVVNLGDPIDEERERRWLENKWNKIWERYGISLSATATKRLSLTEVHGLRLQGRASRGGRFNVLVSGLSFTIEIKYNEFAASFGGRLVAALIDKSLWARCTVMGDQSQCLIVTRIPLALEGGSGIGLAVFANELDFDQHYTTVQLTAIQTAFSDQTVAGMIEFYTIDARGVVGGAYARAYPDRLERHGIVNAIFFRRRDLGDSAKRLRPAHEIGHLLLDTVRDSQDYTLMHGSGLHEFLDDDEVKQAIFESGPMSKGTPLLRAVEEMSTRGSEEFYGVADSTDTETNAIVEELYFIQLILEGLREGENSELRRLSRSSCPDVSFAAMRALAENGDSDFFLSHDYDARLGLLAVGGVESPWAENVFERFEGDRIEKRGGVEDAFQARERFLLIRQDWIEGRRDLSLIVSELWIGYEFHRDGLAFWEPAKGGSPTAVWAYRVWKSAGNEQREDSIALLAGRPSRFLSFLRWPRLARVRESLW